MNSRLGKALGTIRKLKSFWRGVRIKTGWKLAVYNAIVVAQLVYGLNTIHLTQTDYKRLDAAQMRTLRNILNIDHPVFSRVSNEEVLRRANQAAFGKGTEQEWVQFIQVSAGKLKKIRPVSELIQERQVRLLGHLLREGEGSVMRRVAIDEDFLKHVPDKRRVGGPRQHWVDKTMERAYEEVRYQTNDQGEWTNSEDQRMIVLCAAMDKLF